MSSIAMFLAVWSLLVLPLLGQSNFRSNCSTPDLTGTVLTAPCEELCSWCSSFYVSSIDLNKCITFDGLDSLIPMPESVSFYPFSGRLFSLY